MLRPFITHTHKSEFGENSEKKNDKTPRDLQELVQTWRDTVGMEPRRPLPNIGGSISPRHRDFAESAAFLGSNGAVKPGEAARCEVSELDLGFPKHRL